MCNSTTPSQLRASSLLVSTLGRGRAVCVCRHSRAGSAPVCVTVGGSDFRVDPEQPPLCMDSDSASSRLSGSGEGVHVGTTLERCAACSSSGGGGFSGMWKYSCRFDGPEVSLGCICERVCECAYTCTRPPASRCIFCMRRCGNYWSLTFMLNRASCCILAIAILKLHIP